ncbi:MAG: hypothetical protein KAS73_02560 [Candidatus Sabulitectum sp.]|nr:hypothetical protein [Candidatus Sabulitectum sp.]
MKERILAFVPALAIVVGLMTLVILGMYALDNQSGHTGANPYVALYVFIPLLISEFFWLNRDNLNYIPCFSKNSFIQYYSERIC